MTENNKIQAYKPEVLGPARKFPAANGGAGSIPADSETEFSVFLRVLRNRRRTVITAVATVVAAAFLLSLLMHPVYRSEATLEIEGESPDITTVQQLMKLDPASSVDVKTQHGILMSDTLARRVINQLHLTQVKEFNPSGQESLLHRARKYITEWRAGESSPESVKTDQKLDPKTYEQVLRRFKNHLEVDPVRDTRLVNVSFESSDPKLSARVVNSIVDNYLQMHEEATRRLSKELALQLDAAKSELEESERKMLQYARQQGLLYLQTGRGTSEDIVDQRLQQIQQELTKAQADRYQKESVYRLVRKGDYGSLPGVFQDKLLQDLTVRLTGLKRQYAELSATFTDHYPKVKQVKNQIAALEKVLARERQRAAENITQSYLAAVRHEALLVGEFNKQKASATRVAEKSSQYDILKRNADTDTQLYASLLQKVKEATLVARIKANNVSVVDAAVPQFYPVRPKLWLNLTLAMIIGLGLGIAAAFLRERLDTSLKTVEDLDRFLGIPALAMIPSVESLPGANFKTIPQNGDRLQLPPAFNPTTSLASSEKPWYRIDKQVHQDYSPLLEAFRNLGTSVMLEAESRRRPLRTLLITSSQPGEGKTLVSVNLAITLAQQGQRVLLIDADMRRPCVHRALGFRNVRGLSGYLEGLTNWAPCVLPGLVPNLNILPAGQLPKNPVALLASARTKALIQQALEDYDHVIIDSPALMLNLADARILAEMVDGTILVVRSGLTPRDFVRRARGQLSNVIGAVLNSIDLHTLPYGYSYYSGYGSDSVENTPGEQITARIEAHSDMR